MAPSIEMPSERLCIFRRHFTAANRAPRAFLTVAPWVDFALLILLVLIQQSASVLRPGVRMELPAAPFADGMRPDALVLTVPQEGMFFFQDERLTMDGVSLALARASRARPDAALIIEADERVAHGTLVSLYNMARASGIREVLLASRLEKRP